VSEIGRGSGVGGHQSAALLTDEWITPAFIIEPLGRFDLDPCAPTVQPWRTADRTISLPSDGLNEDWDGRVWLNPPYSEIGRWTNRMASHNHGTMLIFARTETRWWHQHIWGIASGILFLSGRIYFCHPDGTAAAANSGAPSALIAYGDEDVERLRESGLPGVLVTSTVRTGEGVVSAPQGERRAGFTAGEDRQLALFDET
jgi:hypothetical protein